MSAKSYSLRELSRLTGATPRTVRKALEVEGIVRVKGKFPEQALERIKPHLKHYDGPPAEEAPAIPSGETAANIDQASGLSYAQLLTREKALATQRANEEEEAIRQGKWMLATDVYDMFKMMADKMEQLPGRIRSDAGLNDIQAAVVQRLIDDIRNAMADQIEKRNEK